MVRLSLPTHFAPRAAGVARVAALMVMALCMIVPRPADAQTVSPAAREGLDMSEELLEIAIMPDVTDVEEHRMSSANGLEPLSVLSLTRADFDRLPRSTIETSTIWTDGVHRFDGVRLMDLLESLGVTDARLELWALNDYWVEMSLEEARQDDPLIATDLNGERMTRRGKGPLWLIYDYDGNPNLRSETIYSRSIWQLLRIDVYPPS